MDWEASALGHDPGRRLTIRSGITLQRNRDERLATQNRSASDHVATDCLETDHVGCNCGIEPGAEPGRDIAASRRSSEDHDIGSRGLDDGGQRFGDREVCCQPRIVGQVDHGESGRSQYGCCPCGVGADDSSRELGPAGMPQAQWRP